MQDQQPKIATAAAPIPAPAKKSVWLQDFTEPLAKMRAQGKNNGEILAWLQTKGVVATGADLANLWQRLLEQQPPSPAPPRTDPQNGQCGLAHGPNGLAPAGGPTLHSMMEKYKQVLDRQIDKVKADPDPDPEKLKVIDRMMRTVQLYDRAQERKEKRKQTDREQKAQKAATPAEASPKAKSGEAQDLPKNFDNTAFIKVMRDEYFKDVNTPENIALVDKMLAECDAKAIAAGMKITPYVPPEPLPPDCGGS